MGLSKELIKELIKDRNKAKVAMADENNKNLVEQNRDLSSRVVCTHTKYETKILCSNPHCKEAGDLFCGQCGNPYCSKPCQKKHWKEHRQWCSKGDHRHRLAHIIKIYLAHSKHLNINLSVDEIYNVVRLNPCIGSKCKSEVLHCSRSHCVSCNKSISCRYKKTLSVIESKTQNPVILSYFLCHRCDTGIYDFCNIHYMMHKGDELCTYPGHTNKCKAKCPCGFYEFLLSMNRQFPKDVLKVIYDFVWPNMNRIQEGVDSVRSGNMLSSCRFAQKRELDFKPIYLETYSNINMNQVMDQAIHQVGEVNWVPPTEEEREETRQDQIKALKQIQLKAQRDEKRRCFEDISCQILRGKIKLENLSVTLSQILLNGGYLRIPTDTV